MKNWKHAVHMGFDHLTEKRTFVRKLNKFRRHGLIQVVDLGRCESTGRALVEFSFPTKEALDSFNKTVTDAAMQQNILQDE